MTADSRYARQTVLPQIGREGQNKISKASVLCVGAGGLGCPALLYLAAAGVGHIGIIDFDVVDESNLQRQVLFNTEQIGQNKAEAAKERLAALNPAISLQSYAEELTAGNVTELFSTYDLIIDGTDNFATKFLINDTAVQLDKPYIYGSILGFEGQAAVFNYEDGPCYRCLFPEPPQSHIPNCAEAGVIGAVAGIIGTTQALEAIKIIVGDESFKPLSQKLWTIDTCSMKNKKLALSKDPQCPVCSLATDEIVLDYTPRACGVIQNISPQDVPCGSHAFLIDVREIDEWDQGHIHGAQHCPLSTLMDGGIPNLSKTDALILYCQKGMRGERAAQILQSHGYHNVQNMIGGYEAWLRVSSH